MLAKQATEPLSFVSTASDSSTASAASAAAAAAAAHAVSYVSAMASVKRHTAAIQKDTALLLLSDVFAVAGRGFAASPLLAACVSRMVTPALLSHAMSPHIAAPCLSICAPPLPAETAASAGPSEGSRPRAESEIALAAANHNTASGIVPLEPLSVLKTVLQVIVAMWASRGCDSGSDESAAHGAVAALSGGGGDGGVAAGDETTTAHPTSIRESCAREIDVLLRAILLHTLSSRAAPALMRQEALDALADMVIAPEVR
jgi:hypothetical protein